MPDPKLARPRRRRLRMALAVALVLVLGVVAALPWLLGTPFGRARIVAGLNRAFAPGRLQVDSIRLSWTGPTRLSGLTLFDPAGHAVAVVASASLDRSLAGLIFDGRGKATLTLDGAKLDVERRGDGSIDLVDALRTVLDHPDPGRDLTVQIAGGSLRVGGAGLGEPIVADTLDLSLHVAPAPDPLAWTLQLKRSDAGLDVRGTFDRWNAMGSPAGAFDLDVAIVAGRWPVGADLAGVGVSARLDGKLDLGRRRGGWSTSGDARLLDFLAGGGAIAGRSIAFDRLDAGWDAARAGDGWSIRRLSVVGPGVEVKAEGGPSSLAASLKIPVEVGGRSRTASLELTGGRTIAAGGYSFDRVRMAVDPGPALAARGRFDPTTGLLALESAEPDPRSAIAIAPGGLRVSGIGLGLGSIRAEGGLSGDVEALDRTLADLAGRSPLGGSGRWSALASIQAAGDAVQVSGNLGVDALDSKSGRPATVKLRARYSPKLDRLDLDEFAASTGYGTLDASGRLDEASGRRVVSLEGTLAPDFGAITALLADRVEPGARLEGGPRAFRASGAIGEGLDAEFGFELARLDIYGMNLGRTPIVLRSKAGRVSIDPIDASLNAGRLRLEPMLDLDAPGGPTLRLAEGSAIRDARINAEVSRRVLAYVAPILDQATTAQGLVSVDLDRAEFPIGPSPGRKARVEGAVVFDDVEFAPGPLARDLLGLLKRQDATLKLDKPVTLTIADGRVNQRGLAIPIGGLTEVELEGWVDFDRNLALTARLPVTPAMLGNNPLLSDIAAGTRVELPIRGTLDRPQFDREAFLASLRDNGQSLLVRGATRGALELLMRATRPKEVDPDAPPKPPKPTAAERREMRREKRAIRRGEIPPPGGP